MIDLGVGEGKKIGYKTQLSLFEEKLVTLFKNAISQLQNVPTLEREIMENLIWTHTPVLASVHQMEQGVTNIQKRISEAIGTLQYRTERIKPTRFDFPQ